MSFYSYWGKARSPTTDSNPYHLLPYHCLDVAAVGQVLLDNNAFLRKRLAHLMQLPEDITQQWCVFLLGLHDLGKFAESFQQLRPDLRHYFYLNQSIQYTNYHLRHDSLGELLWQQVLKDELLDQQEDAEDFIVDVLDSWLKSVFGHHGWPPDQKGERVRNHFQACDIDAAKTYLQDWQALIAPDFSVPAQYSAEHAWCKAQTEVSWLLAGIAVLCDWLGSDQTYFTYHTNNMALADYWHNIALVKAADALNASGVLPKLLTSTLPLSELFPFINQATPLQEYCAGLSLTAEPQLFILEDVTGAGKTEAALILAQHLMAQEQANGLYIGLPTMATANAMYERMGQVYRAFYEKNQNPSLVLSHSARHLSDQFQASLLEPQPANQNYGREENISAQCNRWLADNRKKALLADIGIGTIDQALLSVMPARHQSLRLLGLLNKILILDEVHAYDHYTGQLLKKLLSFHTAFGGSTLLLSATLTRQQRENLLSAFYGKTYQQDSYTHQTAYPLLTQARHSGVVVEAALSTRESVRRQVKVELVHNIETVLALVIQTIQAGKNICWIRNTVPDAREAWELLAACGEVNEEHLHLFHSRFVLKDRLQIEQTMLSYFGKHSTPEQRRGRVLIATQVVEQSLDLDFDVMVSDLAPIDLLIQRAGRLQRHSRDEQGHYLTQGTDQRGIPVLSVLTPPLEAEPQADWYKRLFPKANSIYPHTLLLWRTTQWLSQHQGWSMPEQAREMLEYVYDESDENIPEALKNTTQKALGENTAKRDMGNFSSLTLTTGYQKNAQWDEEARVLTRLGEESHTIYLACWQNGVLTPWINEGRFQWDLSSLNVSHRQLTQLAPIQDEALQTALQQLKTDETLFDEHSVILPLVQDAQSIWHCQAVDGKDRLVEVIYSSQQGGLLIEKLKG